MRYVIILLILPRLVDAAQLKMDLTQAVNSKLVSTSLTSLGGHLGAKIRATIYGLTKDTLEIDVPPGTYLSCSVGQQNLFVVKHTRAVIKGLKSFTSTWVVMCANRELAAPKVGTSYKLGRYVGRAEVLKFCWLLDSIGLKDFNAQRALWCCINGTNPLEVFTYKSPITKIVIAALCSYQNIPFNYIGITFDEQYNGRYFSTKPNAIVQLGTNGSIFLEDAASKTLEIVLCDEDGTVIRKVPYSSLGVGTHNLWLQGLCFNAPEAPGNYYVRLSIDGMVTNEWLVEVGFNHLSRYSVDYNIESRL